MQKIVLNEKEYNNFWRLLNIVLGVDDIYTCDYEVANKEVKIFSEDYTRSINITIQAILDYCYCNVDELKVYTELRNTIYDEVVYTSGTLDDVLNDNVWHNVESLLHDVIDEIEGANYE